MAPGWSSIGAPDVYDPRFVERIFADGGYQGAKAAAAVAKTGSWKLEIVKRNERHRFVVLPKRWIVERTLAWISNNRRLARDFERYARSAAAFVRPRHDPHHAQTLDPVSSLFLNPNFLDRL